MKNEPTGNLILRERGSTTFKECGWCEYATGSHRYNYCISGCCELRKDYDAEVKWSDKCFFSDASKSDIQALIDYHERDIKNSKEHILREEKYIKKLSSLIKAAVTRPPLPSDRKYNHFNTGDEVAVFINDKWHFGKVAPGYRHHDGCVSYILKDIGPQEKDFWECGVAVPIVLLKNEYDFFKKNNKEYDAWCKTAYSRSFNGKTIDIAPII